MQVLKDVEYVTKHGFFFYGQGERRALLREVYQLLLDGNLTTAEVAARIGKHAATARDLLNSLTYAQEEYAAEAGTLTDKDFVHGLRWHWTDALPLRVASRVCTLDIMVDENEARSKLAERRYVVELLKIQELGNKGVKRTLEVLGVPYPFPTYTPPKPLQKTLEKYVKILTNNGYDVKKKDA